MCAVPQLNIKLGVTSAGISFLDIKDPFATSFVKSRGAIADILAQLQIPALTYRGTASAGLPRPQSKMLLLAL